MRAQLALVCASVALLAGAFASPAAAGLYHPKEAACGFGPTGTSASVFNASPSTESRLTIRQASHGLFVTSNSPSGVFGFDVSTLCPAGESGGYPLLGGFEPRAAEALVVRPDIEADNSGQVSEGNLYLANGAKLLGISPAGLGLEGFPVSAEPGKEWEAVAVDPDGNVWAADFRKRAHELDPATGGELRAPLDLTAASGGKPVSSIDFDAQGNLYVGGGNGVAKLAAPGYEAAPVAIDPNPTLAITVDRAAGDLYVAHEADSNGQPLRAIDRYDAAGGRVERFPTAAPIGRFTGLAVDETNKAVYAYEQDATRKVVVYQAHVLPDLTSGPLSDLSATAARLNGTVHPDGVALSACQFEWVSEAAFLASGFEDLSSGGEAQCEPPFGSIPGAGTTDVSAAIEGLEPQARYRFRITASNENGTISSVPVSFALAKPGVETVGSAVRSATTARLAARVDPHGIPTTYHFEYLSEAQFKADGESFGAGTQSTGSQPAGSGGLIAGAFANVAGLAPATAYRYRVVAENAGFGAAYGQERSLTTRGSDAPLAHGEFPGPPGSDRAWEQVNQPDTSGNPVQGAAGVADSGEAAVYRVTGGTGSSPSGSFLSYFLARRPAGEHPGEGWQTEQVFPSRKEAPFDSWLPPTSDADLATLVGLNRDLEDASPGGVWRMPTGAGGPSEVFSFPSEAYGDMYIFSDDGSRQLLLLKGSFDSAHPSPSGVPQLYDVSSGVPRLVLLPGETVPACGTALGTNIYLQPGGTGLFRSTHWLAADGSRAFFPNSCETGVYHLYTRDFAAKQTTRIDGAPLSGPQCPAAMIRSTPSSVYFWTQARLSEEDTAIASITCGEGSFARGGDVYRYEIGSEGLACLTCGLPGGAAANVFAPQGTAAGAPLAIAVAPQGPRIYFTSYSHLLGGAQEAGEAGLYRLDTESGELAYVGPLGPGELVGENPTGGRGTQGPSTLSPDGRYLAFASAAAGLDSLSGSSNGATVQSYLYDDVERSLVCVSCPADGAPPRGAAGEGILRGAEASPNMTSLSSKGELAFTTPTALVAADQNTAPAGEDAAGGADVYEYRDGRALLVSDGLRSWPNSDAVPRVAAIGHDGRDLFFREAAKLTADAPDSHPRLYDARIGGGIDFPPGGPGPCDLNSGACEGPASAGPELPGAGSAAFSGAGNPRPPRACKPAARRAQRLSRRAKQLRRGARRAARHGRRGPARRLNRKARGFAKQARRQGKSAKRCRRAKRRAAR